MDRTPEMALDRFLKAERSTRISQLFLLTPIDERAEDYDQFVEDYEKINPVLQSFTIKEILETEDGSYLAKVDVSYASDLGSFEMENAEYEIHKENEVFKITKPEMEWVGENTEE
jgi:hypothetical protein